MIDGSFDLSSRMWFDRLVGFGQVVKDLSVGFSCPFHCGSSILLPFLSGLSIGLVLGISLTVTFACCFLLHFPHLGFVPPVHPHPVPSAASVIRRRLAGYVVHE